MKSQNLHPIIIGGGIAGPALALLLKKAGMSSTVYEAHPRLENVGGGFTIAPNGTNVLEEVGVADLIAGNGALVSEFCFRDHRGKVLARYRAGNVEKYRWPSVAISRTTLHRILMEEVARQGIQVEYHKRLKQLTTIDGGRIVAVFEDGTTAQGDFLGPRASIPACAAIRLAFDLLIRRMAFTPANNLQSITNATRKT